MRFAFAILTGLALITSAPAKEARATRPVALAPDQYNIFTIEKIYQPAATHFGSWATSIHYCPAGSYVNAFRLHIEPYQGGGRGDDDTGLNKIELRCATPAGAVTGTITSDGERWGQPRAWKSCPAGHFMFWYQIKSEAYGGDGHDDTGANGLRIGCRQFGSSSPIPSAQPEDPGLFGNTWSNQAACSQNRLVVGLRTQVEAAGG